MYVSVWDRLRRTADKEWQDRFQTSLMQFRDAQRTRATLLQNRQAAPSQTVESCLAAKRVSEPFKLAFAVNEYAESLNLDTDVFHSPRLEQLRTHALDAVIWMKVRERQDEGWHLH